MKKADNSELFASFFIEDDKEVEYYLFSNVEGIARELTNFCGGNECSKSSK